MKLSKFLPVLAVGLVLACAAMPQMAKSAAPDNSPSDLMTSSKADLEDAVNERSADKKMAEGATAGEAPQAEAPPPAKPVEDGKPAPGEPTPPTTIVTTTPKMEKLPGLLARISGENQEPLPLVSQETTVLVDGTRARVVMDLVFANPSDRQLSGNLMINLPQGASPAGLIIYPKGPAAGDLQQLLTFDGTAELPAGLWSDSPQPVSHWLTAKAPVDWGPAQVAKVVEPVQARQVYEQTVRRRVDPALAEWTGGNSFSTRVFPLPPHSLKRVAFIFDRPVPTDGKTASLDLPPAGALGTSRLNLKFRSTAFSSPSLLTAGAAVPLEKTNDGYQLFKVWPGASGTAGQAVSLTAKDNGAKVIALAGQAAELPGTLVHALYRPPVPTTAAARTLDRAVILLDTSYSGKDRLFSLSGRLLRALLEGPAAPKQFQVVAFDVAARPLTTGWTSNTPSDRAKLLATVESTWLEGATNFQSALDLLANQSNLVDSDAVFLLSDGQVNWGVDNVSVLERSYPDLWRHSWFCYTWGESAVNRPLFDSLSRSGGRVIPVAGEGDLAAAAQAHTAGATALLALTATEGTDVLVAGNPAQLYPGQILDLALKVPAGQKSVTLTLKATGFTDTATIDLTIDPLSSALAARSWADLYVQRLLSLNDSQADRGALALSQRFTLSNRMASLLILETDAEYTQAKIVEQEVNYPALLRLAKSRGQGQRPGSLAWNEFPADTQALLGQLKALDGANAGPWLLPKAMASLEPRQTSRPLRFSDQHADLYNQAQSFVSQDPGAALRILSTIVEINPGDDQGVRLVGFTLTQWGLYQQAEDIFGKLRRKRPFEPQNYLWEAMAQTAQGRLSDAAAGYEKILQSDFPRFGSYAKQVAAVLYHDLLAQATQSAKARSTADLANALTKRMNDLTSDARNGQQPEARIVVFWNLDDTDLDLHVKESNGQDCYYGAPSSSSGGQLFWDNTEGLGPEIYTHPKIPREGLSVNLHYYGSSSVEGKAPAASLVALFRFSQGKPKVEFINTLLTGSGENLYLVKDWR